jgi:nitrogenase molybdenum-iron protein alpha chain
MGIGKKCSSCTMPGVWSALAHNEGAVVIYHSPKACAHVGQEMNLALHYRYLARQQFTPQRHNAALAVSSLTEQHSIFGGVDQLRACIDDVVMTYKPTYIVIANSCLAGVIGDDTEAVAKEAEQAWKLPIMTVPCHGFLDGDYYMGFYQTGKILAERFMSCQSRQENTVVLLGERGRPNGQVTQEITQLLQYFGLQIHCSFPSYASLEQMQLVPASALSIVLGGTVQSYSCIRQLGTYLQDEFAVPFFDHDYPVGWQATKEWLRNMGEFLGCQTMAVRAEQEEAQRLHTHLRLLSSALREKSVVLCIGRPLSYFDPNWILELFALADISFENIVLLDVLIGTQRDAMKQALQDQTAIPVITEQESNTLLERTDLVLTTHELPRETMRQVFLPLLPPAGVDGLSICIDKIIRLMRRYGQRGGIVYV